MLSSNVNTSSQENLIGNITSPNPLNGKVSIQNSLKGKTTTGVSNNYESLKNKPMINEIELVGNKTNKELGLQETIQTITNFEIEEILKL